MRTVLERLTTLVQQAYAYRHPNAIRPYLEACVSIVSLSIFLKVAEPIQDFLPPDVLYLLLVMTLALRWGLRVGTVSSLLSVAAENIVNPDQIPTQSVGRALVYLLAYTAVTFTVGILASFNRAGRLSAQEAAMRERAAAEHQRRMIGILAHDLKAPLTAARGYIELGLRQHQDSQNTRTTHSLKIALLQLDRLTNMITNLVEASRMEQQSLTLHAVPLRDVLSRAVTTYSADVPILFDALSAEGLAVRADLAALSRILDNLLSNAVKYSSSSQPIQLLIRPGVTPGNPTVAIRICDRGIGVPPEEREQIFTPYYRGSNHGSATGTGVGLYICRVLAQKMNGSLHYEENPGGGSVFVLTLPLVALAGQRASSQAGDNQETAAFVLPGN